MMTTLYAVTPMDAPLREGGITSIQVEYKGRDVFPGGHVTGEHGIYHYDVYVPKGYAANPNMRYPVMFSMMGALPTKWLEDNNWIYISLREARNGPWGPIIANFCAAHDDAVKRLRIAEGRKYATGFSGGSRGSSVFVNLRPGFAGLWLQGSALGYLKDGKMISLPRHVSVYATFGSLDSNLGELNQVRSIASVFAMELQDSGHNAADQARATRAMEWFMERLYLNTPAANIRPFEAAACFEAQYAVLMKTEPPYARYRKAVFLQQLANRYGLHQHPPFVPKLREVAAVVAELTPRAAMEKQAHTAYIEAQNHELRARTGGQYPPKPANRADDSIISAYRDMAAKFKNTEFGSLAEERVKWLEANRSK